MIARATLVLRSQLKVPIILGNKDLNRPVCMVWLCQVYIEGF